MGSVRYEVREQVAEITLARPERLNAFDTAMVEELAAALAAAEDDADVGAVLLTGEGRGFCAGLDLTTALGDANDGDVGAGVRRDMERGLNPLVQSMVDHRVPVVTAVNGVAAGGGMGLALAGDIVIAAGSARFVQVFTPRLAIAPDTGSTWLLSHLLGRARARGLTLLGETIDADTALDWGLVWRVVGDEVLLEEARRTARRLAAGPTHALAWTRRLLDEAATSTLGDALAREAEANGELTARPAFREGVTAFREKRDPVFDRDA